MNALLQFSGMTWIRTLMIIRRTWHGRPVLGIACLLICGLLSASGQGITSSWENAEGGEFNEPGNWNEGVPGVDDKAYFNINAVYGVALQSSVTNAILEVSDGFVTFNLADNTYRADNMLIAQGNSATAAFTNGILLTSGLTVQSGATAIGEMIARGIELTHIGELTVSPGYTTSGYGLLRIDGGATVNITSTLRVCTGSGSSDGRVVVSGPETVLSIHGSSSGHGLWMSRGGGSALVESNAVLNVYDGRINLEGRQADNTFTVDNATVNHTGGELTYIGGGSSQSTDTLVTLTLQNNAIYSNATTRFTEVAPLLGREARINVESGSRFYATGNSVKLGSRGHGVLNVSGGGQALLTGGHLRLADDDGGSGTVNIAADSLLSVKDAIVQQGSSGEVAVAVSGAGAGIEAGDFYLGLANEGTEAVDRIAELTVSEAGSIKVADLLRVGSLSTLALDGGTVTAGDFELMAENSDRARLSVNLQTGGTAAQITATGEAALGGADFELTLAEAFESEPGDEFTIIAAGAMDNEFNELPEGSVIEVGDYYQFRVSYTDNKFTLRTMPPKGTIIIMF